MSAAERISVGRISPCPQLFFFFFPLSNPTKYFFSFLVTFKSKLLGLKFKKILKLGSRNFQWAFVTLVSSSVRKKRQATAFLSANSSISKPDGWIWELFTLAPGLGLKEAVTLSTSDRFTSAFFLTDFSFKCELVSGSPQFRLAAFIVLSRQDRIGWECQDAQPRRGIREVEAAATFLLSRFVRLWELGWWGPDVHQAAWAVPKWAQGLCGSDITYFVALWLRLWQWFARMGLGSSSVNLNILWYLCQAGGKFSLLTSLLASKMEKTINQYKFF